jgi:hypothetical protein
MNTADVITAFLNNELSPEQEREFLLSVAASDAQRLALKSHVMLDRVLVGQMQRTTVPDAVRATIFSAAAASLAEPLPVPETAPKASTPQPGLAARLRSLATRAAAPAMATLMTVAGFAAGYQIGADNSSRPEQAATVRPAQNNAVQSNGSTAVPSVSSPAQEMIPQTSAPAAMPERQSAAPREVARHTPSPALASHRTQPARPAATSTGQAPAVILPQPHLPTWNEGGNVSSTLHVDVKQAQRSEQTNDNDIPSIDVTATIKKPSDSSAQNRSSDKNMP